MNEPVSAILEDKGNRVETTTLEATVTEAVRVMNRARIGSLVVVDGERPVGIFTERDVLTRVVDEGRDPKTTRVGEVMTRELAVIGPSTQVNQVMAIMTEKRYRHLPVVAAGRLAGMISIGDVTRWSIKGQQTTIEDLLSYITGEYPYPK
jgi:CBS domain-containing protein